MATIHFLPTEIINRIIYLATPTLDERPSIDSGSDVLVRNTQPRARFLTGAQLVHPSWRHFAYEESFREVYLSNRLSINAFLEVELEERPSTPLVSIHLHRIRPWSPASYRMGELAVMSCIGVEELELAVNSFDATCLESDGLSGLSRFTFEQRGGLRNSAHSFRPLVLPFSLDTLILNYALGALPYPELVLALCQTTITNLKFNIAGSGPFSRATSVAAKQLLRCFAPIAPHLVHFHFSVTALSPEGTVVLDSFFAECTALSYLVISPGVELDSLAALPSPLVSLSVLRCEGETFQRLYSILDGETIATSCLVVLRMTLFPFNRRDACWEEQDGWWDLARLCERRGITIEKM